MQSIEDLAVTVEELASSLEPSGTEAYRDRRSLRCKYRQIPAEVLRDMLRDLKFMQIPRTDNDVVLQAYATILLRKLGVIEADGASQEAIDRLIATARLPEGA